MAYRFERDHTTVQKGVRKIAVDLIEDALECASAKRADVHEIVHAIRKDCKKLRGLIRLVRPVFNDYRAENTAFRDAGRKFSVLRDCGVLIETYDSLLECYKDEIDRAKFAPIRRHMTVRQKQQAGRNIIPDMLTEFRTTMTEARTRANHWRIAGSDFKSLEGVAKISR